VNDDEAAIAAKLNGFVGRAFALAQSLRTRRN
jgi:hypothetical protein